MKRLLILMATISLACGAVATLPTVTPAAPVVRSKPPQVRATSEPLEMPRLMWNCANAEGVMIFDAIGGQETGAVIAQDALFSVYGNDIITPDMDVTSWYKVSGGYISADYVCDATAIHGDGVIMYNYGETKRER
jgi:hypothetical protein